MTIRCGGMPRSITSAAHAIAAAVTAIVIACQLCRRKSLAGMQRDRAAQQKRPLMRCGASCSLTPLVSASGHHLGRPGLGLPYESHRLEAFGEEGPRRGV